MTTFDSTLGAIVHQIAIDFAASGDNVIIPGLSGQVIRVLQFFFVLSAATNVVYKSGSTVLSGSMQFPSAGAQVQDFIQLPLHCNAGDSFVLNSSNAVQVGGMIWYFQS